MARRPLSHLVQRSARRALHGLVLVLAGAGCSLAQEITGAEYVDPTTRYPHDVLGDAIEHETLRVTFADGRTASLTWPDTIVFEDTAPRLVDIDGDGAPEVLAVESHEERGARLVIYRASGTALALAAATPFIGQRFRWLAPLGAADLDGDGRIEIAYIDRPHLARTLRIWRYDNGSFTQIAAAEGLTNHRIGERDIAGGIRTCAGATEVMPEMILATADWTRLIAARLEDGRITTRDIGPHRGRASFAAAMACR